jgi:hypothetical protein
MLNLHFLVGHVLINQQTLHFAADHKNAPGLRGGWFDGRLSFHRSDDKLRTPGRRREIEMAGRHSGIGLH